MARLNHFLLPGLLGAVTVLAQAPVSYTISGVAVDHRTHAPLSSVLVSITPVSNGRKEAVFVMTGADGRFEFSGLAAAKYSLSAQRRSEQPVQFRQHGPFSTAIVTGPGLDSEHIVFPLAAESRLSGTVVDEEGDPVTGATVILLEKQVFNGKGHVVQQGQKNMGYSGTFHFAHLKPGTYYLAVSARPWYGSHGSYVTRSINGNPPVTESVEAPPMLDVAYPVTYSGDTTDPAAAQPIVLTEGASVQEQINLHAVPALHVSLADSGAGSNDGSAGGPGRVPRRMMGGRLSAVGPGGVRIFTQAEFGRALSTNGGNGGEEINGIAPGTYRLDRQVLSADGRMATGAEEDLSLSGSGPISMAKSNAVVVRGQLVFNGAAPKQNVFLQVIGAGQRMAAVAPVQQAGAFAFQRTLTPGHYRMALTGDPGIVVRSITVGKDTRAGSAFDISTAPPDPLELAVTVAPASNSSVSGAALRKGQPVAGAMILLVPVGGDEGAPIGRDQSDSDGTFSIPNVEPGHYALVAIDSGDNDDAAELEYRDPAVIKPYLAQAQSLLVPLTKK
ncbi:MAG: carboxypeptidase-like regulatory domain-containing protein, partial [Acidobacteriota bacterium]|nr:carboxypeptidase-like regulatory domain-containing protein [Acidobacteriota bacterium]